jgi:hypothetical protein
MTFTEILETAASVVVGLGGGGAIVFGLSGYLGRVWADRALERQRQENAKVNLQISHQLGLDVERFKAEIKAGGDAEIERIKAFLARASHVHERQLDVLGKLYRNLYDAQAYFQSMMRTGRGQNEAPPEAYAPKVAEAVKAAFAEFLDGKLLIPSELVQKCEQFFSAMFEGRLAADLAREVAFHPTQQIQFTKEAAEVAFKQLPSILQQIYDTGRAVIHGEAR